jgi:hypothetical protein
MTALTNAEIEDYYQRVRDSLADLEVTVRDDLLEDLPDHLAEVAAEATGSLIERLGPPEAYAAELRTAAGLAAEPSDVRLGRSWAERGHRLAELLDRADVRLARPIGYARLSELLVALRPGWWVLRGWLAAQLLCGTHDPASWHGFVPRLNGSPALGFIMLIAVVAASIWLGRRTRDWTVWPRRLVAAAGVLLAGWGVFVLTSAVGGTAYDYNYAPTGNSGNYSPLDAVTDVYGYDGNGNPVPGLRLFDQAGNPIQLGSPACQDGSEAPGAAEQSWTYPLCPSDPGPFRAGPGALPTSSSGQASGAVPSSSSAQPNGGVGPSGSASPTRAPSGSRPTATPTRSR